MPYYRTHDQATKDVLEHIERRFRNNKSEFIEYVKVDKRNFYKMLNGEIAWADAVLDAIKYEREKLAYVRAKK